MAKQRQVRLEQRSALAAMQQLEHRSDEELEAETRYRAAAQAVLGARAAERYDSKVAREHFRKAIAAARPQDRMQLRRMADASLALAERRADDLKASMERLGQTPPSGRQLMMLRLMGLVAPPPGSNPLLRVRGFLLLVAIVAVLFGVGFGIVFGIGAAAGGISIGAAVLLGLLLVLVVLGVMALLGRRKQRRARARAAQSEG